LRIAGPPPNALELEFEPVREGWSIYKVKDGQYDVSLRAKLIVLKLFVVDVDSSGARFAIGSNLIISTIVPAGLKGEKSQETYPNEVIVKSLVAEDLPVETVREDWNDYKTREGITFSIKLVVTTVSRSSKHDANGDPIYWVLHQTVQRAKVPDEIREQLSARLAETKKTP
jgi:hypothetical protein